ncbi:MAG: 5,10-methylenetetrahydrofolate reductase [Candidatus Abyssobacteria bacterium SURF_5]|uniref:5,10-methylenetetrahydrofolate reductase n=1 Tax=Abyssobacteria bacterium (strain SURF_5) TaxID=2093360 RepID=A0A3A4NR33_ABYX5|nr:MAG: 5,10-methylenetetrahydrofolate reductase [Candidatus Abyssubacteria bacterium SURF_5]
MIITSQKPLEEIKRAVAPFGRLALIGCGGCASVCQTGGTKQVEELARRLDDKEIVFTFQIEEPCDHRVLTRELARIEDRLAQVDAVLVLACGIGVQLIGASIDKPVLTGLDTIFPGAVIHSGKFLQSCGACAQCLLNSTAAICPRTLCPKGIAEGPCSEKVDERCPVYPEETCVWIRISDKLEKAGTPSSDFLPLDWAARSVRRKHPVPSDQQ